jgi:hypothetical protein
MDEVGCSIFAHNTLGIANLLRFERSGTKLARIVDQRLTERKALHLVTRKGTGDVVGTGFQFAGQDCCIKRRFRDTGRDVRARNEGCVAKQCYAPERHAWRFKVGDRLKQRLIRPRYHISDHRWQQRHRITPHRRNHVGAYQRRWNR